MTEAVDVEAVCHGFAELFKEAFLHNCDIDEASVSSEELQTLAELDFQEVLENFRDLVTSLLAFKQENKHTEKAELARRNEQFENMLQKLEAEVRSHISIEHQLKLHVDATQAKLDVVERKYARAKDTLQSFTKPLKPKLISPVKEPKLQLKKEVDEKEAKIGERTVKRDNEMKALQAELQRLKERLRHLNAEQPKTNKPLLRKHSKKAGGSGFHALKKQTEERSHELSRVQHHLAASKPSRTCRRSMGEADLSSLKKEDRPKSRPVSRCHSRSHSDYAKPPAHKRAPSR